MVYKIVPAKASDEKKPKSKSGIIVIQSPSFGQEGEVLAQRPPTAKRSEIKTTLLLANEKFAASEEGKVYSDHVAEGRREGVFFENVMPLGKTTMATSKSMSAVVKVREKENDSPTSSAKS